MTTSKGFNSGNKAAEEAQEIRACVVNYYKILIPRINEAMDTDLKVIDPVRKFFSNGQIYLVGDGHRRRKGKKDGYLLRYRALFPIPVF